MPDTLVMKEKESIYKKKKEKKKKESTGENKKLRA